MKAFFNKWFVAIIITVICIGVLLTSSNELYIKSAKVMIVIANMNILATSMWQMAEYIRDYKYKKEINKEKTKTDKK